MNKSDLDRLKELSDAIEYSPTGEFCPPPTKVLIVDDEPQDCKYFKRLIKSSLNVDVYTAESARDALELMDRHHDDIGVMISDIRMPQVDGVELVKIVKKRWPHTVCLLTTAYATPVQTGDQGPHDGLVAKPWDAKHLIRLINMSILKAAI